MDISGKQLRDVLISLGWRIPNTYDNLLLFKDNTYFLKIKIGKSAP